MYLLETARRVLNYCIASTSADYQILAKFEDVTSVVYGIRDGKISVIKIYDSNLDERGPL